MSGAALRHRPVNDRESELIDPDLAGYRIQLAVVNE
jgi:hypothetical protein